MVLYSRRSGGWVGKLLGLVAVGLVVVCAKPQDAPTTVVVESQSTSEDAKQALHNLKADFIEMVKGRMSRMQEVGGGELMQGDNSEEDDVELLKKLGEYIAKLEAKSAAEAVSSTSEVTGGNGDVGENSEAIVEGVENEGSTPMLRGKGKKKGEVDDKKAENSREEATEAAAVDVETTVVGSETTQMAVGVETTVVGSETTQMAVGVETTVEGEVVLCTEMNLTASHVVLDIMPRDFAFALPPMSGVDGGFGLDDLMKEEDFGGSEQPQQVVEHMMMLSGAPINCVMMPKEIEELKKVLLNSVAAAHEGEATSTNAAEGENSTGHVVETATERRLTRRVLKGGKRSHLSLRLLKKESVASKDAKKEQKKSEKDENDENETQPENDENETPLENGNETAPEGDENEIQPAAKVMVGSLMEQILRAADKMTNEQLTEEITTGGVKVSDNEDEASADREEMDVETMEGEMNSIASEEETDDVIYATRLRSTAPMASGVTTGVSDTVETMGPFVPDMSIGTGKTLSDGDSWTDETLASFGTQLTETFAVDNNAMCDLFTMKRTAEGLAVEVNTACAATIDETDITGIFELLDSSLTPTPVEGLLPPAGSTLAAIADAPVDATTVEDLSAAEDGTITDKKN